MAYDYIQTDLAGYPFNGKYPPEKYDYTTDGALNPNRATIFHDFAVQGYDLTFKFNGKHYYCLCEKDYVASCDSSFCEEYERFCDANDFIENFLIDGNNILSIIDQLEEVEAV